MSDNAPTTIGTQSPLAHAQWEQPPYHVPTPDRDEQGRLGAYKTELVLCRTQERTEKILWWHAPDPRREPHNHPWRVMRSTILHGGFTETRWYKDTDGNWASRQITHRAGETYELPNDEYHTVDSVEPGTVTHLVCLDNNPTADWGYLLDGEYVSTKSPNLPQNLQAPNFFADFCEINPHKRPKP